MPAEEVRKFVKGGVVSVLSVKNGLPNDSLHPEVAAQAFRALVGTVPDDALTSGMGPGR
jgi:hypothetical protein